MLKRRTLSMAAILVCLCMLSGCTSIDVTEQTSQNADDFSSEETSSIGLGDVTAETNDAVLNNFSVDDVYFPAGQDCTILFTVEASGIGDNTVDLTSHTGEFVGEMHDDGNDGDAVANDGIYTYSLSTNSVSAGSVTYYASAGEAQSDQIEIYFFSVPTEETVERDQAIRQEITDIESNYIDENGYVPMGDASVVLSEVESYASDLQERGDALFYEASDHSVMIKLSSGLSMYYEPNIEGVDSIGANVSMDVMTCQPCLSMYSDLDEYMVLPDRAALEIDVQFSNYSYSRAHNADNGAVSLEKIRSFGSNEIILWHGHGGYTKSNHSLLLTGEDFDWNAWWWDLGYFWDCVQDRIIEGNGRAIISSKYIDKYCGSLDNSFIYLAACQSGKDSVLAEAFLNKGAKAVIANTETIYTIYNLLVEHEVAYNLTQINSTTNNYNTLSEALTVAKNKYGANDSVWYTGSNPKSEVAAPKIFGGTDANNYRLADVDEQPANDDVGLNYYEVIEQSMTWEKAKEACEAKGGHLATITSLQEQELIELMIQNGSKDYYWLGGTDGESEGDWKWITGEAWDYENWGDAQPNNDYMGQPENYLAIITSTEHWNNNTQYSHEWNDFSNSDANHMGYICEWDTREAYNVYLSRVIPDENIEMLGDTFQYRNHSYQVFRLYNVTGTDVIEFCESIGGYFAHINDESEDQFLFSYFESHEFGSVYFGYSDEAEEGTWQWIDGESSSYENWKPGEPNNESGVEHYALLSSDGGWNDGKLERDSNNSGAAILCEWNTTHVNLHNYYFYSDT